MNENRRASLRSWAEKMGGPWSGHEQAADAVLELLEDYEGLQERIRDLIADYTYPDHWTISRDLHGNPIEVGIPLSRVQALLDE